MAFITRCQIGKNIPILSKILSGSGSRFIAPKNLPIAVRNYNSLVSQIKKSSGVIVPIKNVYPKSNKLTGALSIFVNQVRSSSSGDHVRLWQLERIVAAAFVALLPATVMLQNPIIDITFATLLVMHAHWGLEAVIMDYARPAVVGPILPKLAFLSLYLMSAVTLAGLLALVYNGPGVGGSVTKLWALGKD